MIKEMSFGTLPTGGDARLYVIDSPDGSSISLCDYGARIVGLCVPDRDGNAADVVWGYDDASEYAQNEICAGAVIGRFASRLENAEITIGKKRYRLTPNEPPNTLHGGACGFHQKLWEGSVVSDDAVMFTYVSEDGDEGFPGRLIASVTYTFRGGELTVDYNAVSDKDTYCNLTNHAFFNLSGHGGGSIYGHALQLDADYFCGNRQDTPMADGSILPVAGTPMDFSLPKLIGAQINMDYPQLNQLKSNVGYNHTYVLNKPERNEFCFAALLYDPVSGRRMEVGTSLPGLHLFSANRTQRHVGKAGGVYQRHGAICFETTFFPNSSRCVWFPDPVLHKGEVYAHKTVFKFSAK